MASVSQTGCRSSEQPSRPFWTYEQTLPWVVNHIGGEVPHLDTWALSIGQLLGLCTAPDLNQWLCYSNIPNAKACRHIRGRTKEQRGWRSGRSQSPWNVAPASQKRLQLGCACRRLETMCAVRNHKKIATCNTPQHAMGQFFELFFPPQTSAQATRLQSDVPE